jgi:signal transduction histidine kinase
VRQYRQPREVIRLRIPRDLVLITDRTALEIIVKNLLDNALKYSLGTSRPLEVTVQARCESRHVHIEVVDRGVGIPKKHRKRIFDRFYRVPQQDGHARRGTGLGLFVASALVRILGGRLTAESAGVGRGTRMHIWIPREPRDVRKASPRGRRGLARTRS